MKKRNVKRKPASIHTDSDGDPLFGFTLEQLTHVPPVPVTAAVRREVDERLEEEAVKFEDDLVSTLQKYFADPEVIKVIGVEDSGDDNEDGEDDEFRLFDSEEVLPKKRKRPASSGDGTETARSRDHALDPRDPKSSGQKTLVLHGRWTFNGPALCRSRSGYHQRQRTTLRAGAVFFRRTALANDVSSGQHTLAWLPRASGVSAG